MNLKKFKKLSGDASFRQFYRTNNSVLVYSKIQKRSNLLNYDAVNKILIKNKILAPGLISQNYKKNFIEIEDFGNKNMLDKIKSCLLYTSPSPRDEKVSRMPSSA